MSFVSPDKKFEILTENLEFDRHNPRLVAEDLGRTATDEQIMRALVKEADISELIGSIVTNNYLDIEPLIVTKSGVLDERNFRVLEGNRRLCAIKFIKSPSTARDCKITLPENVSQSVMDSIRRVTVLEVQNEIEARAYIGFKHINGPHRWDSYAKAKFLVDWYMSAYESGITIEAIAGKMGDNNSTVRSLIGGMLVLKQAEDVGLFNRADRQKNGPFGFSHFYTALGRSDYREFLGLASNWNARPSIMPVSLDNLDNLKRVLVYIYGSKSESITSVIGSQNPDLKRLGEVLSSTRASSILYTTNSLTQAYEEVRPAKEAFEEALIIAHVKVKDVLTKLAKFSAQDGIEMVELAGEMKVNAGIIHDHMVTKNSSSPKK